MCSGGITTRAPTGLLHRITVQTARPAVNPAGRGLAGVRFINGLQRAPHHADESAPSSIRATQQVAGRRPHSSLKPANSSFTSPQTSCTSSPQSARAPTPFALTEQRDAILVADQKVHLYALLALRGPLPETAYLGEIVAQSGRHNMCVVP